MDAQLKAKWVDKIKTEPLYRGQYYCADKLDGAEILREKPANSCVMCKLFILHEGEFNLGVNAIYCVVCDMLGIKRNKLDNHFDVLVNMNDTNKSVDEIVAYIEKNIP